MFALPFANTLHHVLNDHTFGRGEAKPASHTPAQTPLVPAAAATDHAGEEAPDLAQRVREAGEW